MYIYIYIYIYIYVCYTVDRVLTDVSSTFRKH